MSAKNLTEQQRVQLSKSNVDDLVGKQLGVSDWCTIDQQMIDTFAELTHDRQWIHTDASRAARGPFGATVAHGFLTLSLLPHLADQIYEIVGTSRLINYGLDRVRYANVVRTGTRVRDTVHLAQSAHHRLGRLITVRHTLELEDDPKPACTAELLTVAVFSETEEHRYEN